MAFLYIYQPGSTWFDLVLHSIAIPQLCLDSCSIENHSQRRGSAYLVKRVSFIFLDNEPHYLVTGNTLMKLRHRKGCVLKNSLIAGIAHYDTLLKHTIAR